MICRSIVITNFRKAKAKSLVKRDARWTLVFHDWNYNRFETSMLGAKVTFLTMDSEQCCIILRENGEYVGRNVDIGKSSTHLKGIFSAGI